MDNGKKLVTVIQKGKHVREYRYDALMGAFFDRIETAHGTVELRDPNLEEKGFTKDEIEALYVRFGMIPPSELPPEPKPIEVEFRGEKSQKQVETIVVKDEPTIEPDEETELRAKLDAAGIKHGTIKKIETLRTKVNELNK